MSVDSGVWERIQDGEPEAIEGLVERYEPHLINYVYRVTGDAAVAEQMFEQAMVEEITRVMTGNAAPHHKLEIFRLVRGLLHRWLAEQSEQQAATTRPEGAAGRVFGALQELPVVRREAVVLKLFHKFSDEDLGELLGTSPGQAAYEVELALAHLEEVLL